jgi:hypothetical protein
MGQDIKEDNFQDVDNLERCSSIKKIKVRIQLKFKKTFKKMEMYVMSNCNFLCHMQKQIKL